MGLITGRGRAELRRSSGAVEVGPWSANLVTRAGLDLVGEALAGVVVGGIAWMAFGSGDPSWDGAPPAPDPGRGTLHREVFRVPLTPGTVQLGFDGPTRTVTARAILAPGEATGELREVALFAAQASARPDSGTMLNHLVHDVVDKGPDDELAREIELRLPDGIDRRLAEAIGAHLVERAVRPWFVGVAVGSDGGAAADGELADEQFRRELLDGEVRYDRRTAVIDVAARFDADDLTLDWPRADGAESPVREVGLVLGDDVATGVVVARSVLAEPHRLTSARPLVHHSRIALGSSLAVTVPDLAGVLLADAPASLGSQLLVGEVHEVDRPGTTATTIVGQDPPAGTDVPELTRVDLTVVHRRTVLVPNVLGVDEARARQALRARDIGVAEVRARVLGVGETGGVSGTIVAVEPPAGSVVERDSEVVLTSISYARVPMPDVRGRTLDSAARVLARAGFLAAPTTEDRPSTATTGTVVVQAPAPSTDHGLDEPIGLVMAVPVFVEVPDVVGRNLPDAAEAIRAAGDAAAAAVGRAKGLPGLSIASVATVTEDGEPGVVLRQEPPGGDRTQLHGGVRLWIVGGESVPVPSVVGVDQPAATRALAAAGLRPGTIDTRVDPEAVDRVVGQFPVPGTKLPSGSAVDLTIATRARVPVPDLRGYGPDAVLEILAARGLVLGGERHDVGEGAPGSVSGQQPSAGTVVDAGSGVDVTYVSGVPGVVGLAIDEARRLLAGVGLEVGVELVPGDGTPGTVLRQDPVAGDPLPADRTVRVGVRAVVQVAVPDLVGRDPTAAASLVERVGLVFDLAGQLRDVDNVAVGLVSRQLPAAGTRVDPGVVVQVWVRAVADIELPDLRGLTVDEADTRLRELGLVPRVGAGIASADIDDGLVAATEPPAGARVVAATIVVLRPAAAKNVVVPDVRAMDVDAAVGKVKEAGLAIETKDSFGGLRLPISAKRLVVTQEPRPGSSVPVGSSVTASLGIALPDVVGLDAEKASDGLSTLGFAVGITTAASTRPKGTVVAMEPAAGSPVLRGARVLLAVSNGFRTIGTDDVRVGGGVTSIVDPGGRVTVVGPVVGRPTVGGGSTLGGGRITG